jgi:hypothetical protein
MFKCMHIYTFVLGLVAGCVNTMSRHSALLMFSMLCLVSARPGATVGIAILSTDICQSNVQCFHCMLLCCKCVSQLDNISLHSTASDYSAH